MKRHFSMFFLVAVVLFFGCDPQHTPTPPDLHERAALADDVAQMRAEIAAATAEMLAEGERLKKMAAPLLASKRGAPRTRPAAVITVPGDFATIQDAVNAAAPGDVILVSGTHTGQGVINIFTDDLTLDGGGDAFVQGIRFQIFSDDVRITGFTLNMRIWVVGGDRAEVTHNDVSNTGSGIAVFGGSEGALVAHNSSHDNVDGLFLTDTRDNLAEKNNLNDNTRFGIVVTSDGTVPADDNVLTRNNVNGNRFGLTLNNAAGNVFTDCNVNGSTAHGVRVFDSTGNAFTRCTVNGSAFFGIAFVDSDGNMVQAGKANGNGEVGIALFDSDNNTVSDSQARGNKTCDVVDDGSGNVFTNNKFGSVNC